MKNSHFVKYLHHLILYLSHHQAYKVPTFNEIDEITDITLEERIE